ncbi:MAG TPA: chromosomal replication initiator protein DnaA [Actinomycetota bacterium]|nr:chromosomal replication initiator protein DnaA [Actinomycetota bacterium]
MHTSFEQSGTVGTEHQGPIPETQPNTQHALADLWERASTYLRSQLGDGSYSLAFGHARPSALEGTTLRLSVPNPFVKEWIEARYLDLLHQAIARAADRPLELVISIDEVAQPPDDDEIMRVFAGQEPLPEPAPEEGPPFNSKYTFDSFVIGSSNRFAHAAAQAVAEAPAQGFNPLFIYGGAGLGKTHLLHAVGHYVRQFHPHLSIRYVSSEQFMNDFIAAVQRRTIQTFHQRYRRADVLLIDDIQFLEGKERTQEEFFHTFNTLYPNSQIVMSSDRPPKKIETLEERLRTRIEWGLITDIQPPDLETRLAILKRKAEVEGLPVPGPAMDYIASRIQTNIRELEGALIRVAAYASLTRSECTAELAQDVLQSLLPDASQGRVTADLIISVAAEYFGVTPDEICSSSRSRPLVNARQVAMYLCRELTDLSLPKIGERFGGRDHSTVIHATAKIRDQLAERQSSYEQVQELTTRVKQAARG